MKTLLTMLVIFTASMQYSSVNAASLGQEEGWWGTAGIANSFRHPTRHNGYRIQCRDGRGGMDEFIETDNVNLQAMGYELGGTVKIAFWIDNIYETSTSANATMIARPMGSAAFYTLKLGTGQSQIKEVLDNLSSGARLTINVQNPRSKRWQTIFTMDAPPRDMVLDYINKECQ